MKGYFPPALLSSREWELIEKIMGGKSNAESVLSKPVEIFRCNFV